MLKLTVLHSTRAGARLADGEFRRFPLVERDGQKCLLSKTSKKFIFFKCLFNVNCVTGENWKKKNSLFFSSSRVIDGGAFSRPGLVAPPPLPGRSCCSRSTLPTHAWFEVHTVDSTPLQHRDSSESQKNRNPQTHSHTLVSQNCVFFFVFVFSWRIFASFPNGTRNTLFFQFHTHTHGRLLLLLRPFPRFYFVGLSAVRSCVCVCVKPSRRCVRAAWRHFTTGRVFRWDWRGRPSTDRRKSRRRRKNFFGSTGHPTTSSVKAREGGASGLERQAAALYSPTRWDTSLVEKEKKTERGEC